MNRHLPEGGIIGIMQKYKDILGINFGETSPRATVCHIIFKGEHSIHTAEGFHTSHAYGVAIRTKSDTVDPEFGKSLTLKRAIKAYLKKKKAERR